MIPHGPSVRELARHLAQCPAIFLEEPAQLSGFGGVHVHAVVSDLLTALGQPPLSPEQLKRFCYSSREAVRQERNRLRLTLLGAWLFFHPGFSSSDTQERRLRGAKVYDFLRQGLESLAQLVAADDLMHDPDRREELVRLGLDAVGILPQGEADKEARDRLSALSSVERERVLVQTREAEARARAVQAEMARKQAEEAAANPYFNE